MREYHKIDGLYKREEGSKRLTNEYRLLTKAQQLESTISQVSKALCGKENATLKELLQAADQLKARTPRWISVEERLPEPLKYVLAIHMYDDDSFEPCIAYYRAGNWFAGTYRTGEVTHWMPLPSTEGLHDDE